jgi:hypothetical protein
MSNNEEKIRDNHENHVEVRKSATEQLEKLKNSQENSIELSPRDLEAKVEKARIEALETATKVEIDSKEEKETPTTTSRRGPINKKQLDKTYKQTMKQVQDELPTSTRLFSKFIHNKTIEKTSDIIGSTIARPDAMLSGAVVAFILTLLTYITAKTIGYKLSGFETIASFIIGWIIGIIYDYLRVLFTGKK